MFKQESDARGQKDQYPSINKKDIDDFYIPVPTIEEQISIISQVEELESEISDAKMIISTVADRKKSVLEKYLL